MNQDSTWGVDLGGSPWLCVRLHAEPGVVEIRSEPREVTGPDLLLGAGPLLAPATSGDPSLPVSEEWPELQTWLGQVRNKSGSQLPAANLIGVAYPRSMPPVFRQFLPILFGCAEASSKGGLPLGSPLVGVDAPVALALEAIARERILPAGTYAVASGRGLAREWTAVTVEKAEPSVPAIRGPLLRIHLGRTAASPDSLGIDPGATRLIAGDNPTGGGASAPVVRLGPEATATGAARFARWLSLELSRRPSWLDTRIQATLLPGTPVITSETIHPIGLIGDDSNGSWFWRRLYEAGTAIPSHPTTLRSTTRPPCLFLLAESLEPAYRQNLWIPQAEWSQAGLRWHSYTLHLDKKSPPSPWLWSLELRDFNGHPRDASTLLEEIPPRWGLPNWVTRLEEDITEQAIASTAAD